MRRRLLQLTMPAGLLMYVVYTVGKRYVQLGDTVSSILCYTSIALMMIGLVYHGWCFGKGKSPYAK